MDRRALPFLAALFFAATSGCNDGTGPQGFVVTGHIQNNTQAAIPANARVVAVWGVSSGTPDYSYVFGEGTINPLLGTFRIEFHEPPPLAALNGGEVGVAFIVAMNGDSWHSGDSLGNSTNTPGLDEAIGLTGQHAVIFMRTDSAAQLCGWCGRFTVGYGVGVGVHIPNQVFDEFQPVSPSSPVLIIDDLANIDVVNWT